MAELSPEQIQAWAGIVAVIVGFPCLAYVLGLFIKNNSL